MTAANDMKQSLEKTQEDHSVLEKEVEGLRERELQLVQEVENLKKEIAYTKKLGGEQISPETSFTEESIGSNPTSAAESYLRMLKATKKEYSILQGEHEKFQSKYDSLLENYKDLQQDQRENVEQLMQAEAQVAELESAKEQLEKELENQGAQEAQEQQLKERLASEYKEKLEFKDSEISSMTEKLARISQFNIEITTKANRSQEAVERLMGENEVLTNKMNTLEVQLELAQANAERESEQMLEKEKEQFNMKLFMLEADKDKDLKKMEAEKNKDIKAVQ